MIPSAAECAELLQAARAFAAAAAPVALRHFRTPLDVEAKDDASPVTRADRETEAHLRDAIAARFPDHGILGEEFGAQTPDAEFVWTIDPIDGTKSFLSGHPLWGMLIGLSYRGKPLLGVIAMPALGEQMYGGSGLGCMLDGIRVHARPAPLVGDALLIINELPRIIAAEPGTAAKLLRIGPYPRAAADCYSYVQLAAGWVDAVVDHGLQPHDWLAVLPVLQAAGVRMTDWQGNPLGPGSDGRVVAARPELHESLLKCLAP